MFKLPNYYSFLWIIDLHINYFCLLLIIITITQKLPLWGSKKTTDWYLIFQFDDAETHCYPLTDESNCCKIMKNPSNATASYPITWSGQSGKRKKNDRLNSADCTEQPSSEGEREKDEAYLLENYCRRGNSLRKRLIQCRLRTRSKLLMIALAIRPSTQSRINTHTYMHLYTLLLSIYICRCIGTRDICTNARTVLVSFCWYICSCEDDLHELRRLVEFPRALSSCRRKHPRRDGLSLSLIELSHLSPSTSSQIPFSNCIWLWSSCVINV